VKVYVAAASAEIERAERFAREARRLGHEVTHDWMAIVRSQTVSESELPRAIRREAATDDIRGVREAEVFIMLVPDEQIASRGIWVELGYAIAARDTTDGLCPGIWCVGESARVSIFTELANGVFVSDADALKSLGKAIG